MIIRHLFIITKYRLPLVSTKKYLGRLKIGGQFMDQFMRQKRG